MSSAVNVAITFSCSGTITLGAPLVVPAGHTVSLSGAGQNVVLSGGNATSMIVDNGNLTLASLTLENGISSGTVGISGAVGAYPTGDQTFPPASTDPSVPGVHVWTPATPGTAPTEIRLTAAAIPQPAVRYLISWQEVKK